MAECTKEKFLWQFAVVSLLEGWGGGYLNRVQPSAKEDHVYRVQSHWLSEVCLDVGGTRNICWINKHRKGHFVSQFLDHFLGISVFRTFYAAQVKVISVSHWGVPGDDQIQQTCHIFSDISVPFGIPFLGNSPLASNFASSTVTLPVTASLGAAVAGPQTEYSCPLAAFQAMRFPQLFTHLKMRERGRQEERGTIYQFLLIFLVLHSLPSSALP